MKLASIDNREGWKLMIGRLLLLVVWCTASVAACATTMDRCLTLDDPAKIDIFKGELTKAGVPYYMDGDIVCVTHEHADQFTTVLLETFPPESSRKLRVPPSPSGIPLNSTMLADPKEHAALEAELRQRGIWFTKDETGAIWYEVTHEKEVQDIMLQVFGKHSKKKPINR